MERSWLDNSSASGPARRAILVIAGPTASGKSALAADLAAELDGVVINADSMQAYRDLPVLTAQPIAEQLRRAPHRLYGFLESTVRLSAGAWADMARREIDAALAAGRVPIIVGGTGLYLRALLEGLSPMPAVPPAIHEEARALLSEIGSGALHAKLQEFDPMMAGRLHPNDAQRVARAWEVFAATGVPLSRWQARRPEPGDSYRALGIVLLPPRPSLFEAIDRRVPAMVESGALSEVARVVSSAPGTAWSRGAGRVLGVMEFARHLAGGIGLAQAVAAVQKKTRQYAKRQITWLRHQMSFSNKITFCSQYEQFSAQELTDSRQKIRSFLLTE